jgi:F-type H+-transporting ATPase subunit epsilon
MAETPFTLRLVTPQRLLLEARVVSLQAPGSEGYLGVLANHAALVTPLRAGRLDVRDEKGERRSYAVSGGFLEISANRATVLADAAEESGAIDRGRADAARKRAEERLAGAGAGGTGAGASEAGSGGAAAFDRDRAQRALERAKNRLAVAGG